MFQWEGLKTVILEKEKNTICGEKKTTHFKSQFDSGTEFTPI